MTTKSIRQTTVTVLLVVLVLAAGCSSLAGNSGTQNTTTTNTVVEGTATAASTPDSSGTAMSTETATATQTAVATPTATQTSVSTETATQTPTATSTPTPTATPAPTETATATQTATPTETPTATPTQSSTQTDRSRPDDMYNLTIVAANDGESHYRVYVDQVGMELGPEADRENVKYPDAIYNDDPYYIQGYIGDGGVDSYYTGRYSGYSPGEIPHYSFWNNGNATLYVYVNGNQTRTVAPGEGVEEDFGPSAPPKGNNTITVKAAGDGASNYGLWSKNESYNPIYVEYGANPYQTAKHPDFSNRYPDDEIPGAAGFVADGGVDSFSSDHKLTRVTNNGTATLKIYQNDKLWATVQPGEEVSKGNQSR